MTRTKDITYKATSRSIDIRLRLQRQTTVTEESQQQQYDDFDDQVKEVVLLDGARKLRGRINVDSTFWVMSDLLPTDSSVVLEHVDAYENQFRQITVTIEKIIATPKDDFDIIDYDWKGIYHEEDPDEVSVRNYDEPEPFNVRQYAAEMGVDIDNLNMSMVDKSMFKSNLNITKSTLQTLHRAGYISEQEITQQADGTEYTINEETGEPELVTNSFTANAASTGIITAPNSRNAPPKIPFIDTDSPWNNQKGVGTPPTITAAPSSEATKIINAEHAADNEDDEKVIQLQRNFTRAAFLADQMKDMADMDIKKKNNPFRSSKPTNEDSSSSSSNSSTKNDPIDTLTVQRLKEILQSQGLKTSGTKQELQVRLRQQVNALLQNQSE